MARRSFRRTRKALTIVIALLSVVFVVLIGSDFAKEMIFNPNSEEDVPLTTTTTEMRTMAKSELLEELGFNYISNSDINGIGYTADTLELYDWCGKRSFTSIRGDVQITADNKLVMCRNQGFTFNEDEKIIAYNALENVLIRDLTEEECLGLRYERGGQRICTFSEYLKVCKYYDKIAFVTIGEKYLEDLIPLLMETLESQDMMQRCIVSSDSYEALKAIRSADSVVMLSYTQPYMDKVTTRVIDDAIDLGNCIVQGFSFADTSSVKDVKEMVNKEAIAYAEERNVHIYEMQVHTVAIARKLKEYGIKGVQIRVDPGNY